MNGAAVLLALASAATWGIADFSGGLLSRKLPAVSVAVVSQAAGSVALLMAFAAHGGDLNSRSFWIGTLAGIGGGSGLAAFYKALSLGTMSIVSPLAACGALVPFGISLASGERPSGIALVGAGLALAGAVLASIDEHRSEVPDRVRAIALTLVAAVAFGLFYYFLGLGSREGSLLSTLLGARAGSLLFLVALVVARRRPVRIPRRSLVPVAAVGLCDVSANALFALASGHGLLSLVSVLGSLYPVATVLLAYVVLKERLTPLQIGGIGVALAGVAALSSG